MKTILITISVLFLGILNFDVYCQNTYFTQKFPELSSDLKFNNSIEFTTAKVESYRDLYIKLQEAYFDIEKWEHSGVDVMKVYTVQELNKIQDKTKVNDLKEIIKETMFQLKVFLKDKTKYGLDSVECIEQLSVFNSYAQINEIENGYDAWRLLFTLYPISNKIIYTKGDDLIIYHINKSTKDAKEAIDSGNKMNAKKHLNEKDKWVDTLLILYDQRIKYFGDDKKYGEGKILGEKGKTFYKYRRKTQPDSAYKYLKQSVEILKDKSSPSIIQYFLFISDILFEAKKNTAEQFVNDYGISAEILSNIITKNEKLLQEEPNSIKNKDRIKKIDTYKKALNNITQKFLGGISPSCDVLTPIFEASFETKKTNFTWLKRTTDILIVKECTNYSLYEKTVVALYEIEPSADAAYKTAKMYLANEKYDKASEFYEKAYTQEEDSDIKAKYYYEAALIANARNQISKSYSLAVKAAETKEKYGDPLILIAQLYIKGKSSCGKDAFEKSWVYWAAVDKLIKAKTIDSSVSKKANKLIVKFRTGFPSQEKAFMHGITPGNLV